MASKPWWFRRLRLATDRELRYPSTVGENPADLPSAFMFAERYRVESRLGKGGMGAVYAVLDTKSRARRALKVMLPIVGATAERVRAKFFQEAQIVGPIESDHIVKMFDFGIDEQTNFPFIVMELLRGDNLEKLRLEHPIQRQEALEWLRQTAFGLQRAHDQGVVHRDLKPENLFLTRRDDGTHCVKIVDFGIARDIGASAGAQTQTVFYSPHYVAPEQLLGNVARTVDTYSLAQIAYTLLVGQPFRTDEETALSALLRPDTTCSAVSRAATCGVALPPAFDGWFSQATHPDPPTRFQKPVELVKALVETLDRRPLTVQPGFPEGGSTAPISGSVSHARTGNVVSERPISSSGTTAPLPPPIQVGPVHGSTTSAPSSITHPIPSRPKASRWWHAGAISVVALIAVPSALWVSRASPSKGKAQNPREASSIATIQSAPLDTVVTRSASIPPEESRAVTNTLPGPTPSGSEEPHAPAASTPIVTGAPASTGTARITQQPSTRPTTPPPPLPHTADPGPPPTMPQSSRTADCFKDYTCPPE